MGIVGVTKNGRKIDAMHRMYGPDPGGAICGDCPHLVRWFRDRAYYKCSLYGESASEATDWRCKWQACMLIHQDSEPVNFIPVIERLKHMPRAKLEKQLDGQMEMDLHTETI